MWYALRTAPQAEARAQCLLTGYRVVPQQSAGRPEGVMRLPRPKPASERSGRSVRVIIPVEDVWRKANRAARKKRLYRRPLMRGWVLAEFDQEPNWFWLMNLPVITGVAGIGATPWRIPAASIDRLLANTGGGHVRSPDYAAFQQSGYEFDPGDKAEITKGPLAGQVVDVRSIRGREGLVISSLLGAPREMRIGLDSLAKVAT